MNDDARIDTANLVTKVEKRTAVTKMCHERPLIVLEYQGGRSVAEHIRTVSHEALCRSNLAAADATLFAFISIARISSILISWT
jgi:hypothetical protein